MRNFTKGFAVLLAVLNMGCLAEVRTSSAGYVNEASGFRYTGTPSDAAQWLTGAFAKRGFPLADSYDITNGRMYVFKGSRATDVHWGAVPTSSMINDQAMPFVLGSVFYAAVTNAGATIDVALLGKPSFDGNPVCSDADTAWHIPCASYSAAPGWVGWPQVSGQQEVDTVRGVIVEAAVAQGVTPEAIREPAFPPSPPAGMVSATPRCSPEQDPAWATASAVEKKRLYDACATPQ
jgi:hypothetical protein